MSGPCTDCGGPDYQTLTARMAAPEVERDALYERRLPYREAEVAQKRYEDAEAELAAVGSDLQDEVEYTIRLRDRAEHAEATIERQREDLATVDVQLGDERLKNRRLEAERDAALRELERRAGDIAARDENETLHVERDALRDRRCGASCANEAPNKNHAMCVGIIRLCNRWQPRERSTP